jgi:stress response protein SCP2
MGIFDKIFKKSSSNKKLRKTEEFICSEFNFSVVSSVELTWIDSLNPEPKLLDCSFDVVMSGLDVYVICLKNGILPDEKSLIFYNNFSNSDESISGDFNCCYFAYPGFDQSFFLRSNKLNNIYDEIIFAIGRPKTHNEKNIDWIDCELVKKVTDEICYVDCKIKKSHTNEYIAINNIQYEFNKYGAIVLFKFQKYNNNWKIDLSHNIYKNGLQEIIEKHSKHGTNSE